jgi:hypothetical protein
MDTRPDVRDAAIGLASVAIETARIPLHLARRLPGMTVLAREGAAVRMRTRSRLEGVIDDVLNAPEVERAVERMLARPLLLDQRVVDRLAAELANEVRDALAGPNATTAVESGAAAAPG